MYSKTINENEYLYSLILFFRKSIPNNEYFYIIFFALKYFPVILFIHPDLSPSSILTITKIFKEITLIHNNNIHYTPIILFMYFIFCFVFVGLIIIFVIFNHKAQSLNVNKQIVLSNKIKIFATIIVYIIIIILLLYHCIMEILFYGIIRVLYFYLGNGISSSDYKILHVNGIHYTICIINCIMFICIILVFNIVLLLSSKKSIVKYYGYQSSLSFIDIIIISLLAALQGVYSTLFMFTETYQRNIRISIAYLITVLMIIKAVLSQGQFNLKKGSKVERFIFFMNNFVLCSGIIEILCFHLDVIIDSQKTYLLLLFINITNTICLSYLMDYYQTKRFINSLSYNYFNTKKQNIMLIFQLYITFASNSLNDNLELIFNVLEHHQRTCKNIDNCLCSKYNKTMTLESNEDTIQRFLSISELNLIDYILHWKVEKKNMFSKIIRYHCEYIFTLKKSNPLNSLYLSNYYLITYQKYLTFYDAFSIYEIKDIIFEEFFKKEENKAKVKLLDETLFFESTKKIMNSICSNIEMILHYKDITYNSNSIIYFNCEDVLNASKNCCLWFDKFIGSVERLVKNKIIEHFLEIKFLVFLFVKLFNIRMKKSMYIQLFGKSITLSRHEEIVTKVNEFKETSHKPKFLILSLNQHNKFIINYVSLGLAEKLEYSLNKLKGSDFHECLFPKQFSNFHEIYMKNYFLLGGKQLIKTTYLLNSSGSLLQYKLICKVLPEMSNLFSLIIQFESIEDFYYDHYQGLLDNGFNPYAISQRFEEKFTLNQKILGFAKINIAELFGFHQEKLEDYFKGNINTLKESQLKLKNKSNDFPAITSIKKEELFYYKSIDSQSLLYNNKEDTIVKTLIVERDKIYQAINRYNKKVEDIYMGKDYKVKMTELTNTLYKNTIGLPNVNSNQLNDYFIFHFQFKSIGNIYYYIIDVLESKDQMILFPRMKVPGIANGNSPISESNELFLEAKPKKGSVFNFNTNYLFLPQSYMDSSSRNNLSSENKRIQLQYQSRRSNANLSISSTDMDVLNKSNDNSEYSLTSQSKIDSKNVSTTHFLVQNQKVNTSQVVYKEKDKTAITIHHIENKIKKEKIFHLIVIILIIIVSGLNFVTFIVNVSTINLSLYFFKISKSSFLISNDIYIGSIAMINACLIKENIQKGKLIDLHYQIKQSSKDLTEHFYSLRNYSNLIVNNKKTEVIYDVFNLKDTFTYINGNIDILKRNTTFVEELYSISHNMKTINVMEENNCRLTKIFFTKPFAEISTDELKDSLNSFTKEEQFLFYICANIISIFSKKLETLMENCYKVLYDQNYSEMELTIFVIVINLVLSICIFIIEYIIILKLIQIIRKQIELLFTKNKNEEHLMKDIKQYENLIETFTIEECLNFSNLSSKQLTTPTKKDIKKEFHSRKRQSLMEKGNTKKQNSINETIVNRKAMLIKKTKPKLANIAIIVISFLCIFDLFFHVLNLLVMTKSFHRIIAETDFASNILQRNPKITELILYSLISVLMNDLNYIEKSPSEYSDYSFSNYFNIKVNLSDNSMFNSFDNSNYLYLYYQIFIIRRNIDSFTDKKQYNNYLKKTSLNEDIFQDKENFCISTTYQYLLNYYSTVRMENTFFFTHLSERINNCRTIGSGVNLNGYNEALNLMLQQLTNRYFVFKKGELATRQKNFFEDQDIVLIENNIVNVFRNTHFVNAYTVVEDIENTYYRNFTNMIIFSFVSILLTVGIVLSLFVLFIHLFKKDISILNQIYTIIDKALVYYNTM